MLRTEATTTVAVDPTEMRRSASHIAATAGGEITLTDCAVKMVTAHMGAATRAAPPTTCAHVLMSAFAGGWACARAG